MGKRLSVERWVEIRRRYVDGRESAKLLAREFGVSASAIYKRSVRDNWPVLDGGSQLKGLDLNAQVERLERIVIRLEAGLSAGVSNGS
ncbi:MULTISPECIES: hypothetical protein [Burkholderia cepacia complex]|uniref:hypothetical protein n=1 Tax=Burkholderia cepacia complex TaxID=87882 RepID=UPI000BA5408A|nr:MULTISPECIES: hypothetical protein [Burkholderia cepacia complex]PAJ90588.1 hypothetical protein CJO69_30595 [Burkholderia ubonensis]PAK10544.1 hypothetical protein CJO66_33940 [Burkholderia ubonensis]RQP76145.1 hypothetical protein DF013_12505 [Burkholderia ubonensis]RQP94113.1 hypothetical protein DF009_18075 [Burkholderia ubonensis]RQY48853.1 hypothetical protein DF111_32150 [Burkholderia stagnalis]